MRWFSPSAFSVAADLHADDEGSAPTVQHLKQLWEAHPKSAAFTPEIVAGCANALVTP
jgi:hypothetical protein